MLSKIREQREEEGFTLIELLVVVIIIGILAAIAIPVFLNQRENAWRSAVESDLRNAAMAVESFYTRQGQYSQNATFENRTGDDPLWHAANTGVWTANDTAPTGTIATVTVSDGVLVTLTVTGETFSLQGYHGSISDESLIYSSSAGGLQDWAPDNAIPAMPG
jgi:type IV pilus assembly protein PilA